MASLNSVIKNKSIKPELKLIALEIIHACAQSGNLHFFSALSSKLIKRLALMATHRIDSHYIERGRDLFGNVTSEISLQASVVFLQKLLHYIECWADSVQGSTNRGALRIMKCYDELVSKGVQFPKRNACLNEDSAKNMRRCYGVVKELNALMAQGSNDTALFERYVSEARGCMAQIESDITNLLGSEENSKAVAILIKTNDDLGEALNRSKVYIAARLQSDQRDLPRGSPGLGYKADSPDKLPKPSKSYRSRHEGPRIPEIKKPIDPLPFSLMRNPEPQYKQPPISLPSSPRSLQKSNKIRSQQIREQKSIERSLANEFLRIFESGSGSIAEEYGRLVTCTQRDRFDRLENDYFAQVKTIENFKVELVNTNETIIMQQQEKNALKELIREQDRFKRDFENMQKDRDDDRVKIQEYQKGLETLREIIRVLEKEKQEKLEPSGDQTFEGGYRREPSKSVPARCFDFSIDNLEGFLPASSMRLSPGGQNLHEIVNPFHDQVPPIPPSDLEESEPT